jgi:eukaryotic-like serine/threonine-protein kinase
VFVWRAVRAQSPRQGGQGFAGLQQITPITLGVPLPVYAMTLDATGRWLATLDEKGVRLWDLRPALTAPSDGDPIAPRGPGLIHAVGYPQELAFLPDGNTIAVIVGNGVRLIDLKGKLLADMPNAHAAETKALALGRDDAGVLLATADANGVVKAWRVEGDGKLSPLAELTAHNAAVTSLAFSPDGRALASAGYDRTVILSDPLTGQERAALPAHADRVVRLQFLPDASALLTIGRDGAVRRWRASGGAIAATLNMPAPNPPPRPRGKKDR